MKISKKITASELANGIRAQQEAWYIMMQDLSQGLVQTEFEIFDPLERPENDINYFGSVAFFFTNKIDRTRVLISPKDIFENRAKYQTMAIEFIEMSGSFVGQDSSGFVNKFAATPILGEHGWCFEFTSAVSRIGDKPHKFDFEITAEGLAANLVCSSSVTLSIFYRSHGDIFASKLPIPLPDTESLRLVIADTIGQDYLGKLLRRHGYQIE